MFSVLCSVSEKGYLTSFPHRKTILSILRQKWPVDIEEYQITDVLWKNVLSPWYTLIASAGKEYPHFSRMVGWDGGGVVEKTMSCLLKRFRLTPSQPPRQYMGNTFWPWCVCRAVPRKSGLLHNMCIRPAAQSPEKRFTCRSQTKSFYQTNIF